MLLTKINYFYMSGNSYGYSCFHHGLNRLRFFNAFFGKTPSFRCHSTLLKYGATVDITPLGISSTKKSLFNFYMKIRMDCGKLFLLQCKTDARLQGRNTLSKSEEISIRKRKDEMSAILQELQYTVVSGMRNKNHLTLLSDKIYSLDLVVGVSDLVKLFYFLSFLKVRNEALLMKISKNITACLGEVSQPVPLITSYLASLRFSLLRDVESLDKVLKWLCSKNLDLKTVATTLHTLAVINYFPQEGEVILKKVESADIEKHSTLSQYLNFVWSLVLLDRAEENMIMRVLDYDFWKKLEYSVPTAVQASNFMKMQNICSYSKKQNINIDADLSWIESNSVWISKLKMRKEKSRDSRHLREIVIHLFPLHTYSLSVVSDSGLIIDVICYLSNECKPITEIKSLNEEGSIVLAITILSFHDFCYPDKVIPNGIVEFHRKSLECEGYKVLFLNHTYFAKEANLEEKCKNLNESIKTVLPNFNLG